MLNQMQCRRCAGKLAFLAPIIDNKVSKPALRFWTFRNTDQPNARKSAILPKQHALEPPDLCHHPIITNIRQAASSFSMP